MHPGIHAATAPDRPAVIMADSGSVITYRDLDQRANQIARVFADAGLEPGDHVAFQVGNRPEFFMIVWAAHRSGLWYTPLATRLTPGESAYIINDCSAKAVIVDGNLSDSLEGLAPTELPTGCERLVIGQAEGWKSLTDVADEQRADPLDAIVSGDDLLYTSGTTGRPKGVERAQPNAGLDQMDSLTNTCATIFGYDAETIYLSPAPLYHAAALRYTRSVHRLGGTVVQMEHFDPEQFLALVAQHRVTTSQVVPTMFSRMLKLDPAVRRKYDVSSLQVVVHSAAPCPQPVKRKMIDWWGPVLWEYYSGTEGVGMTLCNSQEWLAHPGTVGRAIVSQVRIVRPDGTVASAGEEGAVYYDGPADFCYRNDAEKTRSAHDVRGWKTLGDIGYLDSDGYLYLTDRASNMIISGGVNIYPQEAENLLIDHAKVADAAVFGVPNEDMGEEVKAVVQLIGGVAGTPDVAAELIDYCRANLAHYKCPRSVDFSDALPRHPTGKLYKRLLRDQYWEGHASRLA